MKIVFVVYNVRRHGDKAFLQNALRRLGSEVQEVNVGPEGPHKLKGRALPKADVVIVHGYMTARALKKKRFDCKRGLKVFYTFNDPPALDANLSAWRFLAQHDFKLVIASQRFGLEQYRQHSKQAYYVPFGCEPRVFKPHREIKTTHDIAFIGDLSRERYGWRRSFLERLKKAGVSVFSTTGPSGAELAKCLYRGRIGWNQTISWHKWKSERDGINFRTWEVLAAGRMLLTNRSYDLDRLGFKDGVHLVYYDRFDDCTKKAKKYARDHVARERIAEAGRRKALEHHTVDIRAWQMLNIFGYWLS